MAHATVDRVEGLHQPTAAVLVAGIEEIPLPGRSWSSPPRPPSAAPSLMRGGTGRGERFPPPGDRGTQHDLAKERTPLKRILCRTGPPKVEMGDGPSKNEHASFSEPISDRHERRKVLRVPGVPFAGERPAPVRGRAEKPVP